MAMAPERSKKKSHFHFDTLFTFSKNEIISGENPKKLQPIENQLSVMWQGGGGGVGSPIKQNFGPPSSHLGASRKPPKKDPI